MPDRPDLASLSPWLAYLYVVPEERGLGVGGRLVDACEALAGRLGGASLYLYCSPGTAPFYRRGGWADRCADVYRGERVTVMEKRLSRPAHR